MREARGKPGKHNCGDVRMISMDVFAHTHTLELPREKQKTSKLEFAHCDGLVD